LARHQSDNSESRRRYEASLESAKAAKQCEHDAELDQELEPQKQTLMREWLANSPGKTEADFNKIAWPRLRTNLLEQKKNESFNAEINAGALSGRYSL